MEKNRDLLLVIDMQMCICREEWACPSMPDVTKGSCAA